MKLSTFGLALLASAATLPALAGEGPTPRGVRHLDHVFLIMMENHGYQQIIGNPYAPFINSYAAQANLATNYFAVAHPSLTNYLEVIGGSNFGILDDNAPDWHNTSCQPNIVSGVVNLEANSNPICGIAGVGTDAATPAIDYSNETQGPPGVINIDGTKSYAAAPATFGKSIADQLVAYRMSWKSYQENLPLAGADNVNYSDGTFTNLTVFDSNEQSQGETNSAIVQLYAVKHNPFAYFANVQAGTNPNLSLSRMADFGALYGDLASGNVPNFSFIAPNQCNDMHGRGNSTVFCAYDPNDNGTQTGLNPGLIAQGDATVQRLITAIHASPAWKKGNNAIVVVWDEDDYSISPTTNQVTTIVETNRGAHGVQSNVFYTHFSLLASLESAFGLPCLNHACDSTTTVMKDLFQ